jgi:hypothetical protein
VTECGGFGKAETTESGSTKIVAGSLRQPHKKRRWVTNKIVTQHGLAELERIESTGGALGFV